MSSLERPFSARGFPVTQPIYYVNGTRDPNTPVWQARAHHDAQNGALRQLLLVVNGGHSPIFGNLRDCTDGLWAAIDAGTGFPEAVASCSWPTELTSTAPTLSKR